MKIISWNVNGIRAIVKKDFYRNTEQLNPDILCLQETKAQDEQVTAILNMINDYQLFSNSAEKKGYAGTAVLTRIKPLSVTTGIGIAEHDTEGRVLCLEFNHFFLVNVYVPNSGSELKRLEYRQKWDMAFFDYLKKLERSKPVIACGDFNVAHTNIDLARPKDNYNKSAGYMQEEIDGMNRLTRAGLFDSFRYFHPNKTGCYSWWSYRAGARPRNIGWRIDYFLVSEAFLSNIRDAFILNQVMGSDHCPVGIEIQEKTR
jgi:exodeoxyribonuclease-3